MRNIKRVLGILIALSAWQIMSMIKSTPALPQIPAILSTFFRLVIDLEYWTHIGNSLSIVLSGIVIAIAFGFTCGLLVFEYSTIRLMAMPVVDMIRGVSGLTLLPLLIILVGIEAPSRIIIIFWTAWPAVMLSTIHALDIDKSITEAAQIDGAGRWRIMFKIRIPVAGTGIMTGIRIGVSGGWISLIAAEMLGATSGLGYFLLYSSQAFLFSEVYATIIVIAVLGGSMNLILAVLQNTLKNDNSKWRMKDETSSGTDLSDALGNGIAFGVRKYF